MINNTLTSPENTGVWKMVNFDEAGMVEEGHIYLDDDSASAQRANASSGNENR